GRNIDVGRRDGASLVRGDECRDGSNVIQGCGPRKQGGLLKTGDDLVAALDSLGKGLGDSTGFDGDHADPVRTELGGPLPARRSSASRAILKPPNPGTVCGPPPPKARITPDPRATICRAAARVVRK